MILQFSQHGLEKYNDVMTKQYFRTTNHKEVALHQIMEKQNRLEHLRDSDSQTSKMFAISCSNCGNDGHNKLTCSHPCKTCKYPMFEDHPINIDARKISQCQGYVLVFKLVQVNKVQRFLSSVLGLE